MSCLEAIEDIAKRMEERADAWSSLHSGGLNEQGASDFLLSCVREIRLVVKAAGGQVQFPPSLLSQMSHHVLGERKEDGLEIKAKEQANREEALGEIMTELVGGPLEGDSIMRPAKMPPGAKTNIAGSIYELKEDYRLHYVQ